MSQTGAFYSAEFLSEVTIPQSTKEIGEWAFADTMLDSVRISVRCTYADTSFPDGCQIWHYTQDSNLLDKNGMYLCDRNGWLLHTLETNLMDGDGLFLQDADGYILASAQEGSD